MRPIHKETIRAPKDQFKIKSNISSLSLFYAEACNKYAGPISASLHPNIIAPLKEMLQRFRIVGDTVSDLTGPRFELQTFRSRDERVTDRPTGRFNIIQKNRKSMTSKFLNISNVTLMNNLPNSKSKIVLKAARLYQNVKRFRPRNIKSSVTITT